MANSSLVSYIDTASGKWNDRGGQTINTITIHHAAGNLSMSSFSSIINGSRS